MKYSLKKGAFCLGLAICTLLAAMLYSLVSFAETEYNDGQSYANSLQINGSVSGRLSDTDDVDYYSFDTPHDGVVILSFSTPLQSDSGDLWTVLIEDNNSKTLMTKNVSGGTAYVSFPSLGVKQGLHYVIVKAGQASKWNENEYTLSLNYTQSNDWEREYNNTSGDAQELEYNTVYRGVIMNRSEDKDWFKFRYVADDPAELCFTHPTENTSASYWKLEIMKDSDSQIHTRNIAANVSETRIPLSQLSLDDGVDYYVVLSAGSVYSDAVYSLSLVKPHQCEPEPVAAKPSTCKEAGNAAHNRCKSEACGKCYDENGNELQNVMLPLAEHAWGDWETVNIATCTSAGIRKRTCSVCQKEELETVEEASHLFNSQSKVGRIEPTCTQKGELRTYCAAAGCEVYQSEELTEKGHDYSLVWTVDIAATCTQTGWESRHCSRCDSKIDGRSIPKTSHAYGAWRTVLFPTCSLMGKERRDCPSCDAYEIRDVNALGHNFEEIFSIDRVATCTQEGSKSRHCTRCDVKTEITAISKTDHVYDEYNYNKDGHWQVCVCGKMGSIESHDPTYTVQKSPTCMQDGVGIHRCTVCGWQLDEVISKSESYHHYTDWLVTAEPTCTASGERKRDCDVCDGTQVQVLDKTPHRYQAEWTEDQAPSCTEDGSRSRHCEDCGDRTDAEVIAATGHTYGSWSVITPPTCVQKGCERRVCRDCSNAETKEINAKGHDFSTELTTDKHATCDTKGEKSYHCSRCTDRTGITEIPALGHRYGDWIFATAPTCIERGTEQRVCTVCTHIETRETDEPLGHVFGSWTLAASPTCTKRGTEQRVCTVCAHTETRETDEPLGHVFGSWTLAASPTCTKRGTEQRVCSVCALTETRETDEPLGHVFGSWTFAASPTCTERGTQRRVCSVCAHTETKQTDHALGHDFESDFTVDSEASCEGTGEKSRHCLRCDEKCDKTEIPALGHRYGAWSISVEPTCTSCGMESRVCERCAYKEEKEGASALGHAYASAFTTDARPTCTDAGSQSRHCERCDAKTDVREIPSSGHVYGDGVVVSAATAESFGIKRFTCHCGYAYTQTLSKLPPAMLNSEEVVWKGGTKSAPVFRSTAALSDFIEVRVNGVVIGSDCYILREGSTVVELTPAYLESLRGGAYTLEIVSTTGTAAAEFTLKNGSPFLWLWILVGVFLLSAIALTVWFLLKKKPSKKPEKETSAPAPIEAAEQMSSESQEVASDVPTSEISNE